MSPDHPQSEDNLKGFSSQRLLNELLARDNNTGYGGTLWVHIYSLIAEHIYDVAKAHGWWETERNDGELIALMHSELSEGLEALRKDLTSDHIPEFKGIEEELADVIIRIMDYSHARKLNVAEAVVAKIAFNRSRPYKHGGKKF